MSGSSDVGGVAVSGETRPIRIGLQLQPQHAEYAALRDAVSRAEDLGVDVIFT